MPETYFISSVLLHRVVVLGEKDSTFPPLHGPQVKHLRLRGKD